mgnify:CR=1 FL=1|jgi:DnaJ-class molecular chaperone with C-terminal Zn finger domain
MESESASPETSPVAEGSGARAGWKWLSNLPVLIGVIGLGAAVTLGVSNERKMEARVAGELGAIRAELKLVQAGAGEFRGRMEELRWEAAKMRANAVQAAADPERSWLRERARLREALVAEVERVAEEGAFWAGCAEVAELCEREHVAAARERLRRLPELRFPAGEVFREMVERTYAKPLAQFSRQNPDYYRLLKAHEPEIARTDFAELRKWLERAGVEAKTPQAMLGFDLLAAVAPADDPLLADWQTAVTAEDFFHEPDEATRGRWRKAQAAVRAEDWPTAVAEMQAIERSKVRTRQPFRAAYGRAILRNKPDDVAAAYPFLQEAAALGDKAARAWVSEQDLASGRRAEAKRWLEERVAEGESEAVGPLLKLYAEGGTDLARDPAREREVLQRIVAAREAPADAAMLLARNYEEDGDDAEAARRAFGFFLRAAEAGHEAAWIEVARRLLAGKGTPVDATAAASWAARAFSAGEREHSISLLAELMRRFPESAAAAVQAMFESEAVAAPGGYAEFRVEPSGVAELKLLLARFLDRKGRFAQAAAFYAAAAARDPAAQQRHAELTTTHACATCGGAGKVRTTPDCPVCAGRGTIACGACSGRGYAMVPEVPACAVCGGAGGLVQDGRAVACATCMGTGKGRATVSRRACVHCAGGKVDCGSCEGGKLKVTKDCTRCGGRGVRALIDG